MALNFAIHPRLSIAVLFALSLARVPGQMIPMETTPIGGPGQPLIIEVWSDVVCPFCYIGKRELENALARFPHRDSVVVVWKSFELDPSAPAKRDVDTYGMLSEKYGMTREQSMERTRGVRERAATLGLHYDFDKTIVGSSFDAHRLLQFSKTQGKGDAMKERLFKAYFTEGRHIADHATLVDLAKEVGLGTEEVEKLLKSGDFTEAVRADEQEAQRIGVQGVPFFVFDRRSAVSGAQSEVAFLQALEQTWRAGHNP